MFERHRELEDPTDGPDVLSAIEAAEQPAHCRSLALARGCLPVPSAAALLLAAAWEREGAYHEKESDCDMYRDLYTKLP